VCGASESNADDQRLCVAALLISLHRSLSNLSTASEALVLAEGECLESLRSEVRKGRED
jgi:hypothetical protein